MRNIIILFVSLLFSLPLSAQWELGQRPFQPLVAGVTGITLEASCTGTGTAVNNPCSAPMTVSAGDTIVVGCFTNNGSFDPSNLVASDGVNGYYSSVQAQVHPANTNDLVNVFVLENSAAGSITPQCSNWEPDGMGISAYAFKGTRTSFVLDGATAINLFASGSGTNPTAGTAGAPTNSNEAVVCMLDLTSSTAVTAGSGYSPSGTLTGQILNIGQYSQYVINPTTANCNFGTTVSKTYTDTQLALLNASHSAGYKALTGLYGIPVSAQTNGSSASVASLNAAGSGTLTSLFGAWSQLAGSPTTWDTSVHPLGSFHILVDGVAHTVGDGGASLLIPSANDTTTYAFNQVGLVSNGNGEWLFSFVRMGSNATNGNFCDNLNLDETLTGGNETLQIYYNTVGGQSFQFERSQGNTPTITGLVPSTPIPLNSDYGVIWHVAGINEPNDELFVLREATPGVLPWVVTDHFTAAKAGNHIITTTASASSGATSITVASATGIVIGQAVYSATTSVRTGQIPLGAKVGSSYTPGSTTVPLVDAAGTALATTASMSSTPVEFAGPSAFQTCSVTAGSATLTCGAYTNIVAGASNTGYFVGMAGVAPGTWVASGTGPFTLSQPAVTTQTSVASQFWAPDGSPYGAHFGKYSSCNSPADMWYSAIIFDPYGTVLPAIANGTNPL